MLKNLILAFLCLILFIPKATWDTMPKDQKISLIQSLCVIYLEKHPGVKSVEIKAAETANGFMRIEVSQEGI